MSLYITASVHCRSAETEA